MLPIDDLAPPDPETTREAAAGPSPKRSGRPGVTHATVADAVDTWVARTGKPPSVRELRTALGDTGSLTTLGRLLAEVRAERLLTGDTPDRGSPEELLLKALKPALSVLAAEAASAADESIAQAQDKTDAQVAAALALQSRAESRTQLAEQERERALGRVSALEEQLSDRQQALDESREAQSAGLAQTVELREAVDGLKALVGQLESQRDQQAVALQAERQTTEALQAQSKVDRQMIETFRTQQQAHQDTIETLGKHREADQKTREALRAELRQTNQQWAESDKALALRKAARDEARKSIARLESAQATAVEQIQGLEADRQAVAADTLKQQVENVELTEQLVSLEKALVQAESTTVNALGERDAWRERATGFEGIQTMLEQLQYQKEAKS